MRTFAGGMAALFAVAVIGCGSGSDTTEAPLTKAQFIKRGDALCRAAQKKQAAAVIDWRKEIASEGKPVSDWNAEELSQVYLVVALPPVKEGTDELAELTPPAGDAKAEKLVETMVAVVKSIEETPIRAIHETPYEKLDQLAQAYGFKACGQF